MGASVQFSALQEVVLEVSIVHGPSDPIKLEHVYVYEYVLQDYKVFTHPLPLVKHPDKNLEQSALVKSVLGASVQARGLHTVEP